MPVVKFGQNADRIPAPGRDRVEAGIRAILERLRPTTERWAIASHVAAVDIFWDIEFQANGRTALLHFENECADIDHPDFRAAVELFIRENWPMP